MAENSLLQIVSGFMPDVDGMGDMARRLGEALWSQHGIRSHFLVYRKPRAPLDPALIAPNTISYLDEPSPQALLQAIDSLQKQQRFQSLLLHYGPYAYTPNGQPTPITVAIESLAKRVNAGRVNAGRVNLLVFFHETYAFGKPWKRAFWTRREQKACLGRLMRCARMAFTSNSKYVGMLEELDSTEGRLIKAPVISNVGEPANLPPLIERPRQLMIFGQLANRIRLYKEHGAALEKICRVLRIERVLDVGSGNSPVIPQAIDRAEVKRLGFMNDADASAAMASCIAGVICYWPDVWEKSGVMAAYEAHAMVPILVDLDRRRTPEPANPPYVSTEAIARLAGKSDSEINAELQAIADHAHAYYAANQSVSRCAEVIARYATQN
jgi:hypothetical protein